MPTNLLPSLSSFRIKDHFYLQQRFSQHGRLAQWAALWLLDMREMRKIEQLVLHGDDETVMAFKTSQIGAVGMTAVSVCTTIFFIGILLFTWGW